MTNKVEVLDISPKGIQVIEKQYGVNGMQTCIHTHHYKSSIGNKLLTINITVAGLPKLSNYPIVNNSITYGLDEAKKLRDMLNTAIKELDKQEYNKKKK